MNFLGESRSQQCALVLVTVHRAMQPLADTKKSEDASAAVPRWLQAAPGADEK